MCVCAAVLCCIQLFFLREFEVKRSVLQNKTKSPRQNFRSAFCLGENADFYQVFFKVESWWTRALQNFEKSSHWSDFWTDWQITQLSQPIKRLQNSKKGKKNVILTSFLKIFWPMYIVVVFLVVLKGNLVRFLFLWPGAVPCKIVVRLICSILLIHYVFISILIHKYSSNAEWFFIINIYYMYT